MADGFKLDVRADTKAMLRDLTRVQRKIAPAAAASALNKAARNVRTAATREISARKSIKPAKLIRERLAILRARKDFLNATIRAMWHPLKALKMVTPKQRAGPPPRVGLRIAGKVLPDSFIAYRQSKRYGVYKRRTRKRFPIKEILIPLLPEADRITERHIETTGADSWREEFTRQMKWRLAKKHGGTR